MLSHIGVFIASVVPVTFWLWNRLHQVLADVHLYIVAKSLICYATDLSVRQKGRFRVESIRMRQQKVGDIGAPDACRVGPKALIS